MRRWVCCVPVGRSPATRSRRHPANDLSSCDRSGRVRRRHARQRPARSIGQVNRPVGILVIALGVGAVIVGVLIWSGALSWFGRLPGDIRIEGEHTRVYIPIVSMLLISVVLSLLFTIFGRFFL
ncbi:MAG: DUF2905 domain-containing protein [Actinobacteria bacterium]|nr:DUF2905 domain-containing protein [Actinomycetota bacterium]